MVGLYRNCLKNWDYAKEALRNFDSEGAATPGPPKTHRLWGGAIAERQGASENQNYEVKPTPAETNSSDYFGTIQSCFRKHGDHLIPLLDLIASPAKKGAEPKDGLTLLKQTLASCGKQMAQWLFVDHPNHWAQALPASFAPTLPIPYKDSHIIDRRFLASEEDQRKVAAIFKGMNLEPFLNESDHSAQQLLSCINSRGSFVFFDPSIPDRIIKGWVKSQATGNYFGIPIPFPSILNGLPEQLKKESEWFCWEDQGSPYGRVYMAQRIRQAVEKEKLDLTIPQKWICPISAEPDAETVVLSEKLDLMNKEETGLHLNGLNLSDQEKIHSQVLALCRTTGYFDLKIGENFCFIKSGPNQGKLALIDTEPLGLDAIAQGTQKEELAKYPEEKNHLYRTIYLFGGMRNLELTMAQRRCLLLDNPNAIGARAREFCKAQDEWTSNLKRTWALRLLLPATLMVAIGIPILQKIGTLLATGIQQVPLNSFFENDRW